jgi:uncharacterized iron-regulated protein
MKKLRFAAWLICFSFFAGLPNIGPTSGRGLSAQETAPVQPMIVRMKDGQQVTPVDLARSLAGADVVFLGEEHDNDSGHALQLAIVQELINQGANIAISMEMFERDVQGAIDEYLASRIPEDMFLANSRPWPNYAEHYRPIIELAREKRIPVIAANVPREIAGRVSRGEAPDLSMAPFSARRTSAAKDSYWQKFGEAMKGHGGTETGDAVSNFYRSQCLKDDTMAESIADFLARHSHRHVTVVHLCGKFHSDFGLGTAARVASRNGIVRMEIVSTEKAGDDNAFDFRKHAGRSHYMFVVPENPAEPAAR